MVGQVAVNHPLRHSRFDPYRTHVALTQLEESSALTRVVASSSLAGDTKTEYGPDAEVVVAPSF